MKRDTSYGTQLGRSRKVRKISNRVPPDLPVTRKIYQIFRYWPKHSWNLKIYQQTELYKYIVLVSSSYLKLIYIVVIQGNLHNRNSLKESLNGSNRNSLKESLNGSNRNSLKDSINGSNRNSLKDNLSTRTSGSNRSSLDVSTSSYNTLIIHNANDDSSWIPSGR